MAARIRKGDTVIVLAGRDKGRTGQVLEVRPKENRALVSGVNMVKRHQRATPGKEAGIINKEAPINLSNVALRDPKDGKPTRVKFVVQDNGDKARVAARSGETIDG